MLAQENILKALTEAYAKYAPSRKMISDVNKKKESFFIGIYLYQCKPCKCVSCILFNFRFL